MDDFDFLTPISAPGSDPLERDFMPDERQMGKRNAIAQMRMVRKKEKARETLHGRLPAPGESHHFISNANFDFWNVIAEAVLIIAPVDEFYGSTWTMNRQNVLDLMELIDGGKILKCNMLTGTYFKRRESSVYAQLLDGMTRRKQRFVAFNNHTKIALARSGAQHIIIDGSANWTANPRLEQFNIWNSPELYDFHKAWMEEMLLHPPKDTLNNDPRGANE